ncbi:YaaA family protein [Agromyces atrinae]|uniref:Peroxide stress protein YaaA n=1 Tax=Agromyces atrinae TaxID=592376 RepID=A0A4Q2M5R7_9MICO|nr:peroxide stress protein YaaA [Agromyces atrinae]NYD65751.1 hypothetical protein [Agromyces atrinae]RXZ85543.1 peroxide stress protein YaaA [Agromyces atrinae]
MLILLPPSETKRDGGGAPRLDVTSLAFPRLAPERRVVVKALRELARDDDESARALKLGPQQSHELARNRSFTTSPTMPAIDRFTGVLFDGLEAHTLTEAERSFAGEHVLIHSALLGPVSALDSVPAYRLSHNSRLPGVSLRSHWAAPVAAQIAAHDGLVLDLRSEGYAALGPRPKRDDSVFVRVVSEGDDGRRRALNHFNKKAKGEFTRAVLQQGAAFDTVDDAIDGARSVGWRLERSSDPGELELVVAAH